MKSLPRISEAEWIVMRVLWKEHPLTAKAVYERLASEIDWSATTVKTLINRLENKGAISFRKVGRAFEFFPVAREEECVRAQNRSFLQRVYGGALQPMLTTLLADEELSQEEIAELKAILDRKEKER